MAEIVDIRQFEARQFLPLLQAESQVWNSNLRWDYASSVHLITSCLEEKRLQGYALRGEGHINGYSFFFYEGEKGLIGNLFVDRQRVDLFQAVGLLDRVIRSLVAIPGVYRIETQLPHFTFEELNPCFLAHRFEGFRRRFMAAALTHPRPARWAAPGRHPHETGSATYVGGDFALEPWERKHDRPAAQLLFQTYQQHVDAVINDQYASQGGASRLIENIMYQRGCGEPLPKISKVAIQRATGRLAGVLALTSVRPRTAHIPQVAIAKEFQGVGLGTVMLETCFQELCQRGFEEVSLTVTDMNVGAVRLYERLGFESFHTFGAFVWNRAP